MRSPRVISFVTALATSSGFTMALFAAVGVFPIGPLLAEVKLGHS